MCLFKYHVVHELPMEFPIFCAIFCQLFLFISFQSSPDKGYFHTKQGSGLCTEKSIFELPTLAPNTITIFMWLENTDLMSYERNILRSARLDSTFPFCFHDLMALLVQSVQFEVMKGTPYQNACSKGKTKNCQHTKKKPA